jgi:hypothetical protein
MILFIPVSSATLALTRTDTNGRNRIRMEVAIVLLYVVVGVCVLACVGMGVVAFLSWRQDRSWEKARESLNDQTMFALEEKILKKDRLAR